MSNKIKVAVASIITVVLVCVSFMPISANALQIKRYYGDIDCDSAVTTEDARIALKLIARIYPQQLYGADFKCADLDNDGVVSIYDARKILKIASGLTPKKSLSTYEFKVNYKNFMGRIQEYRRNENTKLNELTLDSALSSAAKAAASEYCLKTGSAFERQDGSFFYKLLDERNIKYTAVDKIIVENGSNEVTVLAELLESRQGQRTVLNPDFKKVGIGTYSNDGRNFYWCILFVK